jgi:hypothetical protein
MVTALRLAASKGAHFAILSDANTFYIREILEVCARAFMAEARGMRCLIHNAPGRRAASMTFSQ